jgi:hypothetical protein
MRFTRGHPVTRLPNSVAAWIGCIGLLVSSLERRRNHHGYNVPDFERSRVGFWPVRRDHFLTPKRRRVSRPSTGSAESPSRSGRVAVHFGVASTRAATSACRSGTGAMPCTWGRRASTSDSRVVHCSHEARINNSIVKQHHRRRA